MQDQPAGTTVATFVESYFGYKSSMMGWLALILAAFSAAFFVASAAALRWIRWQNR